MTPYGETKKPLTLTEGRLGLTHRRPNFPPTGTHPSPRSALVWRSASRSSLLLSTSKRTPCTLWSLMGNTATPHWVLTRGSHWLVLRPPYRKSVTRKGSMLCLKILVFPKPGSVSLVTTSAIAEPVTLELGLVLEEIMITTTHAETRLVCWGQIMARSISRQWDIFWCSKKKLIFGANLPLVPKRKCSLRKLFFSLRFLWINNRLCLDWIKVNHCSLEVKTQWETRIKSYWLL